MARYFFHLADGHDVIVDREGREVADVSELAALAMHEARAMMSHEILAGRIGINQSIQVRDAAGTLVHELSFGDAVTIRDDG